VPSFRFVSGPPWRRKLSELTPSPRFRSDPAEPSPSVSQLLGEVVAFAPACSFCLVHGGVGVVQDLRGAAQVVVFDHNDSDAGPDADCHVVDDDRFRQGRVESVGECVEVGVGDLANEQGDEFVTAKPGHHVVVSDRAAETLRRAP